MEIKEFISLTDAGVIAGCNASTLRRAIKNKKLAAVKFGKSWVVTRSELQRWIDDPMLHTPGVKARIKAGKMMTHDPQEPEDKGIDLLAMWQAAGDAPLKFPIAPDVKRGDAVYLSSQTGQYEKVTETSDFHGIFDGYDVILLVTVNDRVLPLRHSPIDGHIEPGVWKSGD